MEKNAPYKNLILIVILGALVYFPVFYRLDGTVIKMWDESRNAVNALEMSHTKIIWPRSAPRANSSPARAMNLKRSSKRK